LNELKKESKMSLQKSILACCFILLTFFLFGCSDNTVSTGGYIIKLDTSTFTYPFKDGTVWNYTRKYSAQNFRPDSVKRYFSYLPLYANGTTTILYDTLINEDTTKCFFTQYTEDSSHFDSREYYANTNSGLICYGYRSAFGAGLTPFKTSRGIHYQFMGQNYGSIQEMLYAAENNRQMRFTPNDTLILEVPPVVCLKYPIVTGTQWLFKNIVELGDINKKYLGFEVIRIGTFFCTSMKTQRIWNSFNDMELYDYYSKFGILKRDYTVKDVRVMNEFGTLLGFVDLNDLYLVTTFNIPQ
jgi:hypothetical protein